MEADAEARLRTTAPDLVNAITRASSTFQPENPMFKSMADLSDSDLQSALGLAQRLLTIATEAHIAALRVERGKLAHNIQKLEQSIERARIRLAYMRIRSSDYMRGDLCTLVLQRWSLEDATKALAGDAVIGHREWQLELAHDPAADGDEEDDIVDGDDVEVEEIPIGLWPGNRAR